MEHQIKILAEGISNGEISKIIKSHVKGLLFNEERQHLEIFVDNAGPLHELQSETGDHHLNHGLAKIYGDHITYEVKLSSYEKGEREKGIEHNIHY